MTQAPNKVTGEFPTTRESGKEGLVSMSVQEYVDLRLAPVRAQRKGDRRLMHARQKLVKIEKKTIEKRLRDLNGEAARLKTVLDASVPLQVFNQYVTSQRDKDDAKENAARERFDAYVRTQAEGFRVFSDENSRRYNAITKQIAFFVGGGTALLAAIQFWMNYGK